MDAVLYGLLSSKIEEGGGGDEGTKKYQHVLIIRESNTITQSYPCVIISNSAEPFTLDSLYAFLSSNGFTSTGRIYPVGGFDAAPTAKRVGVGIYANIQRLAVWLQWGDTEMSSLQIGSVASVSSDTVIEL